MPNSYKYFDANLFFQGKMDAGHGRLFLAARCLTLPTPPEFHPGPFNLNLFASGIDPQKVTVILGPSGSGKSTILNLMGGMDHPTSGKIEVFQEDISGLSEKALTIYRRQKIGFVFQFYNLIPSLKQRDRKSVV